MTAPQASTPPPDAVDADELARLRDEVAALRQQAGAHSRRGSIVGAARRVLAPFLIAVCAFALVVSVVGLWAATTALNTDRWVSTVAPLPRDPQVAAAVSEYATTQVFAAVDIEQRLREALPERATFIAGPVAGQLRGFVRDTVSEVLRSEGFQPVWQELNRRLHQRAVAIINGTSDVVVTREDRVELDLLPLINQVLRQLSAQLPTLFGKQLSLPDISSGAIPDNLRTRVQEELGVTLPANFAQFTVYDSGQLWAVQQGVANAKRGLAFFAIGTILLLVVALLISPTRRRTLLQLGLWLVVAAVAVTAVLRAVRQQLLLQVPDGVYRDGVAATVTSVFSLLRTRGHQLIWIGAVLAVLMYLIGPGRGSTWVRRQVVAGARAIGRGARRAGRGLAVNGPGWSAAHLDALRIGGLALGIVLALILSSWTSLLVIALVLAAYEVAVVVLAGSANRRDVRADGRLAAGHGGPGPG